VKILFLTDNFPPEVNAPATRTFEHCRLWVKLGHTVDVITCAPNFPKGEVFPGYRNKLYQREVLEGITVHRVWSFIWPNKGRVLRILDYLSFMVSSFIAGLCIKADVIVATSPQFFTAVSGGLLGLLKRTPWVFEVRDLWPESIAAVGAMKRSLALRMIEKVELALYRSAARVVVVTESFEANITGRGIPPGKISVITNGVNPSDWTWSGDRAAERERLGLHDKFIVGYAGTMGMAHALDFIVRSASKLKEVVPDAHIVLIGDGAERGRLQELVNELKPTNVTLMDSVSKEELKPILSSFDVALVNLRRAETFKTVLPSKIFESAAMGKPILLGVDGEARALVERFKAGIYFTPEDECAFIEGVATLQGDSNRYLECVRGAGDLARSYSRDAIGEEMLRELLMIAARPTPLPSPQDVAP
jgi:glycosyltransferase involved in cell wall biosynthesis